MTETTTTLRITTLRVHEVTPAYWRVTLDNPPLNLFNPEMFADLRVLMDLAESSRDLRVLVLDSANPEYFSAHIDLQRWTETAEGPGGAPYSQWPALVTRLVESPVVTIASIRGRARGAGHELALACDMRFASRENAVFGQLEVALGVLPGGGGVEWLAALAGRHRALEVILSSDDYDADTAESYGWINRAVPDDQLDSVVDRLARRIASFDSESLRRAKTTVNARSLLPSSGERAQTNAIFHDAASVNLAAGKPAVGKAFQRGLQTPGDYELHLGTRLGELDPTVPDPS
jgi:enoyl-CoA hydratase/carnithine racemase